MQSKAATVKQYLAELPPDRREAIEVVRQVILKNLDRGDDGRSGYEEGMTYGMIGYFVPHRVYPPGYHCDPRQPLPFAGLASQKNYMSLYLCTVYGEGEHWRWFHDAWAKSGKKLDMGKCCIRFRKVEDLALDVIGEAIRRGPVKKYIAFYEGALAMNRMAAAERSAARKAEATGAARPAAKPGGKKSAKKAVQSAAKPVARKAAKRAAPGAARTVSKKVGSTQAAKKTASRR